jgi:hypothetical protein
MIRIGIISQQIRLQGVYGCLIYFFLIPQNNCQQGRLILLLCLI